MTLIQSVLLVGAIFSAIDIITNLLAYHASMMATAGRGRAQGSWYAEVAISAVVICIFFLALGHGW